MKQPSAGANEAEVLAEANLAIFTNDVRRRYGEAKRLLPKNLRKWPLFDRPVLVAGDGYPACYLEHNLDHVFYSAIDPEAAIAGHDIFYAFQRADGLFPGAIADWVGGGKGASYRSVHILSSLATTAWLLAERTGRADFLDSTYVACARYDDWLMRYRNRRGTGLVEMYCQWDTGHDHSRRVSDGGLPEGCPGEDAVNMPDLNCLPIIAPDLSAMLYGGRVALASIADALGKTTEAEIWRERAAEVRQRIHDICYDPEDEFFYDVDAHGRFRKYRTEHITRMFMNHVVDQPLFDRIYERHFKDPRAFNTPFPYPSIALDDPAHDHGYPENSWGGQSQALTAQRTVLWMGRYGRHADFAKLAETWVRALASSERLFTQEMHPVNGRFSKSSPAYTPSLLLMVDFTDWLVGKRSVTETFMGKCLHRVSSCTGDGSMILEGQASTP